MQPETTTGLSLQLSTLIRAACTLKKQVTPWGEAPHRPYGCEGGRLSASLLELPPCDKRHHWERRLLPCSSSEAPVLKTKPKDGLNELQGSLLAYKGTGSFRLLVHHDLLESLCPCTAAEQHGQYCKLWRLPVAISHPQVTTTPCVPDSGLFIKACPRGCRDSC